MKSPFETRHRSSRLRPRYGDHWYWPGHTVFPAAYYPLACLELTHCLLLLFCAATFALTLVPAPSPPWPFRSLWVRIMLA